MSTEEVGLEDRGEPVTASRQQEIAAEHARVVHERIQRPVLAPDGREQMADGMAYMRARYRAKKFFAYFQAFSNTYAPVEKLRALYDEAISFSDVVGLDKDCGQLLIQGRPEASCLV